MMKVNLLIAKISDIHTTFIVMAVVVLTFLAYLLIKEFKKA
jgi:hypothetical protein